MNDKKCYVLTCNCYSGDNGVSAYWNKEDAYKAMINELAVEIINLENSRYDFRSVQNDDSATLFVIDGGIYYEWYIEETTIR